MIPYKQIRAVYDERTVRVYQAFNHDIADTALANGRFVSPPFKLNRMTWIKPSFLWMMYRAGFGFKDEGQSRILAIDITHHGFHWALQHSCGSHIPEGMSAVDWERKKGSTPVRIQWDPERDLGHTALDYRSIQIGLSGEAVSHYVSNWIVRIDDITPTAHDIYRLLQQKTEEATKQAKLLCPDEQPYHLIEDHENFG